MFLDTEPALLEDIVKCPAMWLERDDVCWRDVDVEVVKCSC